MAPGGKRTYQEIESAADFYAPGVYELLPRFSNLKAERDPLDGDFIPLTSVGIQGIKDAKPFIIGIMPPTSNVTGRLLDRSASIASITETATEEAQTSGIKADPPSPAFYDEFVRMCNRLRIKPEELAIVFNGESRMNPHAVKGRAKGLNQMTQGVAQSEKVGMPKDVWEGYENLTGTEQLPWIEKSLRPCAGKNAFQLYCQNLGGFNNPVPAEYNSTKGQVRYVSQDWVNKIGLPESAYPRLKDNIAGYMGNKEMDYDGDKCISDNDVMIQVEKASAGVDVAAIEAAKRRVGTATDSSFTADALSGQKLKDSWENKGSGAAQQDAKNRQKIANKDLNLSEMGQKLAVSQIVMVKATLAALETMKNTPPLRMLVNPQSFKVSSEKIVSDGNRSRSQFIIEHWGEQQDKIEASGKVAGFYAADMVGNQGIHNNAGSGGSATAPYPETVGTYPGLTRNARQFSFAWQNFLSLFLLYRSNGGLYLTDFYEAAHQKDTTKAFTDTILSVVGSIYIYYDNILYIGSFDTFTITEADTAPFTIEYSFSFTVRAAFLLDSVEDPRFTYGAPRLFDPAQAVPTVMQPPPDPRVETQVMTPEEKVEKTQWIFTHQTSAEGDPMAPLDDKRVVGSYETGGKNQKLDWGLETAGEIDWGLFGAPKR